MGLHTGEPLVTDEGYVGIDVHRAARIAAAGHGGQILVSQSTRDLAGVDGLRDLGEHRLKDLTAPERIYQLDDDDFPPLTSLNQTNLPVQPSPLIGRESELAEVIALVRTNKLVTLTGAGGSGKTRLALQAAAELVDNYSDGVWFVSLAALREPRFLEPTIAQTIGAREDLQEFLRRKNLLLVLDNLEQLLPDTAPMVASLDADVLATSRERLNVYAEQEYPVPTLPVDDAVTLFAQRARQLKPSFQPDEHVRTIARRLDGLPLALELAAGRVKVLTTGEIAARLARSLELLKGGARDAPERQRTLRATIEWSYELLGDAEKRLVARLAVFAGSFDLSASEDICDADLDLLQSLVDKSLLRQTEAGRFFMLATIQEYAVERLERSGDECELRRRHAEHFQRLAEEAGPHLDHGDQPTWLARLEPEHDNILGALTFLEQADEDEALLRLALGAWRFWWLRGYLSEGRKWIEEALTVSKPDSAARGAAFEAAYFLAYAQGDSERARAFVEEWVAVARAAGAPLDIGRALHGLANVTLAAGDRARAVALERESIAFCGDDPFGRYPATGLGYIALLDGDLELATRLLEESLERERSAGDVEGVSNILGLLGLTALNRGDEREAIQLLRQGAELSRELGHTRLIAARTLQGLAALLARHGHAERAAAALGFAEALVEGVEARLGDLAEQLQERTLYGVRSEVGETRLARAWADGRRLQLDGDLDALFADAQQILD
jgi:predicted ATPase